MRLVVKRGPKVGGTASHVSGSWHHRATPQWAQSVMRENEADDGGRNTHDYGGGNLGRDTRVGQCEVFTQTQSLSRSVAISPTNS